MAELCRHMVRVRRTGKISRVALIAILIRKVIVAVRVTRIACRGCMRSGEREVC